MSLSVRLRQHQNASPVDEEEERVARRKELRVANRRMNSSHTMVAHGTGTVRGRTSVWNQADKSDENVSYYQRQQRLHGRGRRGSTAVAGGDIWSSVFGGGGGAANNSNGNITSRPVAEEIDPDDGMDGRDAGASAAYEQPPSHMEATEAGEDTAAHHPRAGLTPTPPLPPPPPPPPAPPSVSRPLSASPRPPPGSPGGSPRPPSSAPPPGQAPALTTPPPPPRGTPPPGVAQVLPSPTRSIQSVPEEEGFVLEPPEHAIDTTSPRSNHHRPLARKGSHHHKPPPPAGPPPVTPTKPHPHAPSEPHPDDIAAQGSSTPAEAPAAQLSAAQLRVSFSNGVLDGAAVPTPQLNERMAGFATRVQQAVRALSADILDLELEAWRLQGRVTRRADGSLEEPADLQSIRESLRQARSRLREVLDDATVADVVDAIGADLLAFQQRIAATNVVPEDATEEDYAELERRERTARAKSSRKAQRRVVANRTMLTHGSASTTGRRAVWNQDDGEAENMSYYERQAKKHGRGRRGSTAVASTLWCGVWRTVRQLCTHTHTGSRVFLSDAWEMLALQQQQPSPSPPEPSTAVVLATPPARARPAERARSASPQRSGGAGAGAGSGGGAAAVDPLSVLPAAGRPGVELAAKFGASLAMGTHGTELYDDALEAVQALERDNTEPLCGLVMGLSSHLKHLRKQTEVQQGGSGSGCPSWWLTLSMCACGAQSLRAAVEAARAGHVQRGYTYGGTSTRMAASDAEVRECIGACFAQCLLQVSWAHTHDI